MPLPMMPCPRLGGWKVQGPAFPDGFLPENQGDQNLPGLVRNDRVRGCTFRSEARTAQSQAKMGRAFQLLENFGAVET